MRRSTTPPRSAAALARLKPAEQEARVRAAEAVSVMRSQRVSLRAASKKAATTPETVLRYFPDTVRKSGGRYVADVSDREPFRMEVISTKGVVDALVRSSRQRSLLGAHRSAIGRLLDPRSNDDKPLRRLRGKRVAGFELETDPERVEELFRVGELDVPDIYVSF